MENEFLRFLPKRVMCSMVIVSALWAGSPQIAFADTGEVQAVTQSSTVKGKIVDINGEPVIGASISVKGTTNGVISGLDGDFSIKVASNATLVISFVGYQTLEVPVSGKSILNITLKEDAELLDEVVVMAYNSTVKRKVVASVTNVDMKQVEKMSGYKDMGNALQGRVAGVIITNNQGGPDSSPTISIRGGGDPMYVIDGIVQDKSAFMRLASQDIESLSVMKDAASSAVYGASAANGIVVVTTKKGSVGKSGMAILKAIISGETDPVVLSDLAKGRARDKLEEIRRALHGRVLEHQQLMLKHQLLHIESLTSLIMDLDEDIKKKQIP